VCAQFVYNQDGVAGGLPEEDDPFGTRFDPFGGADPDDTNASQGSGDADETAETRDDIGFVWEGAARRTTKEQEVTDRIGRGRFGNATSAASVGPEQVTQLTRQVND
jgi:hypothetical protein